MYIRQDIWFFSNMWYPAGQIRFVAVTPNIQKPEVSGGISVAYVPYI